MIASAIQPTKPHFLMPRYDFAQRMAWICVATMVCISIIAPPIVVSDDLPYVKAEHLLFPFILVVYGWMMLAGYARTIRFNGMFVIGTLYAISILFSIWSGATTLRQPVILRDFYEIPKALLPVAFFTLTYEANLSEDSLRRLLKYFSLAVLAVCAYGWGQFAGAGVTSELNQYYSAGEHIDRALHYVGRVYSTMGNPNVLGQLLSWMIPLFLLAALFRVGSRAWNIGIALACIATLAMTESRYGLLTMSLGVAMVIGFIYRSGREPVAQLGLVLSLVLIFACAFGAIAATNQFAMERLQSLRSPLQTDSASERLNDLWLDAFDDFARAPVLGNGPAKAYFAGTISDTEYLDVLKQFGIVGFSFYIAYYIFPLYLFGKGLRACQRAGPELEERMPAMLLTLRASFIMVVLALVMNIGESTFYHELLQGFLWMWAGLGARSAKTLIDAARYDAPQSLPNRPITVEAARLRFAAAGGSGH